MLRLYKYFLPIIVIILLGVAIYANSLNASFQFDDFTYIVNNPSIRDISQSMLTGHSWSHPSRIVVYYSFALNYHLHQLDVFGYHLVNLIIHVINAILVWWFVQLILNSDRFKDRFPPRHRQWIALFSALLFISHPIQTQAVTYVTQRFASLATSFYLFSLCLYMKGRYQNNHWIYFLGSLVVAILGMFTKQIMITLPIMMLITEFTFFRSEAQQRLKPFHLIVIAMLLLLIPSLYSFNVVDMLSKTTLSQSHQGDELTSYTYFLTQSRVIMTYLRLLIFPIFQNLDYDFSMSKSFFDFPTLISFLCIIGMLVFAWKFRKKAPIIAYGAFWFFVTLSVESSFITIKHVIFEHRLYLPSVGFCLILSVILFKVIKSQKQWMISAAALITIFSFLAISRNNVWKDEIALWSDVIKKSPLKAKPYINLGVVYEGIGRNELALNNYHKALSLDPNHVDGLNNRGVIYTKLGKYDLAARDLNRALSLSPTYSEAYNNRGDLYMKTGQITLAIADYNKSIELKPYLAEAYNNRGVSFHKIGQYQQAFEDYQKALELKPFYAHPYLNRGNFYLQTNRYDDAMKQYAKALEIDPNLGEVYMNLSIIKRIKGDLTQSLEYAEKAVSLGYQVKQDYLMSLEKAMIN